MSRLDAPAPPLTLSPDSRPGPEPGRRLFVLVPHLEIDAVMAARRVWELAHASNAHIQLIGLYVDAAQEPGLRRQMATLSAMLCDGRVFAETEAVFGKDWVEVIRSRWRAGDVVVCFAEHRLGPLNRPLSHILQSNLVTPLYILSRLDSGKDAHSNRFVQAAAWIGSLGIIAGFFLLQIQIGAPAQDWVHTSLFLLSIPVEIWTLWAWNALFD